MWVVGFLAFFVRLYMPRRIPLYWSECVWINRSDRCVIWVCVWDFHLHMFEQRCGLLPRRPSLSPLHPSVGRSGSFSRPALCFIPTHSQTDVLIDTMSYFLTSVGCTGEEAVCVCVCVWGVKSGSGGTSSCLGEGGAPSLGVFALMDLGGTFSCDWLMSQALLSAL